MVTRRRGAVRVEIVPWLTHHFESAGSARVILEEDVDGTVSLGDFLAVLAGKYPGIGAAIVDLGAGALFEHVSVVRNDAVLASDTALGERIEAGDTLVFLPAFSGG